MKKSVKVIDIPIHTITKDKLEEIITKKLNKKDKPLFITTVNSSFILKSIENKDFARYLKYKSDINVADGTGVQLAAEYLEKKQKFTRLIPFVILWVRMGISYIVGKSQFSVIKQRITGVEITDFLLKYADKKGFKVLIIHKKTGLLSKKEIEENFNKQLKGINCKVINIEENQESVKEEYSVDIVLSDLGEVRQELFMYKNKDKIKAKIYIGIGSSLDILFNKIKPAPNFFKKRGLEWLFRIITRPKRARKAFISTIIFPYKVYKTCV